ncbi:MULTISPECIES: hypothetical protein [unclassified Streptomyces]|uniref:hypothetical protein n=1 Tax=unclassified Streptomyces TaxID=2593676 RepID=UPI0018D98C14|nr:hypothetical protein [Streptomyces sp. HB-N217]MBH5133252.1 hypothetical protein [Streptomyces sp. HB-N217]
MLGIDPGAKVVRMRHLRLGNGPSVELFQVADTAQREAARLSDVGLQHMALYVDDIDEAERRVTAAGGVAHRPVADLAGVEEGPGNRWVYTRTPWGCSWNC